MGKDTVYTLRDSREKRRNCVTSKIPVRKLCLILVQDNMRADGCQWQKRLLCGAGVAWKGFWTWSPTRDVLCLDGNLGERRLHFLHRRPFFPSQSQLTRTQRFQDRCFLSALSWGRWKWFLPNIEGTDTATSLYSSRKTWGENSCEFLWVLALWHWYFWKHLTPYLVETIVSLHGRF